MALREKEIELTTLHKYFKDTESDLHRQVPVMFAFASMDRSLLA